MEMTWQQKWFALKSALTFPLEASLRMREVESWYCSLPGLEVKGRNTLSSPTQKGKTPEEAVEQAWIGYAEADTYLVSRDKDGKRRAIRWNGFMWECVREEVDNG